MKTVILTRLGMLTAPGMPTDLVTSGMVREAEAEGQAQPPGVGESGRPL